jgi:hypothetical protein
MRQNSIPISDAKNSYFSQSQQKLSYAQPGAQSGTSLLCLALYFYHHLPYIWRNLSTARPLDISEFCFKFAPFDAEQNLQLHAVSSEYAQNEEQTEEYFYSAIRINPLSTLKFSPLADRTNSDQSAVEIERKII